MSSAVSGKTRYMLLTADLHAGHPPRMAVSHSYFRGDGLNNTGYIDDYAYATAAKQSSKVSGIAGPNTSCHCIGNSGTSMVFLSLLILLPSHGHRVECERQSEIARSPQRLTQPWYARRTLLMSIGLCLQARTEFTYSRSANPFLAPPPNLKACTQCGTTRTPQWREGPEGASSWLLKATGHLTYYCQL